MRLVFGNVSIVMVKSSIVAARGAANYYARVAYELPPKRIGNSSSLPGVPDSLGKASVHPLIPRKRPAIDVFKKSSIRFPDVLLGAIFESCDRLRIREITCLPGYALSTLSVVLSSMRTLSVREDLHLTRRQSGAVYPESDCACRVRHN